METRYRSVSYSCPRTEVVRVKKPGKTFLANVSFNFVDKTQYSAYTQANFNLTLNKRNLHLEIINFNHHEPVLFLAKHKRSIDTSRRNIYEIFDDYKVFVASKADVTSPFSYPLEIRPKVRNGFLKIKAGHIQSSKALELTLSVEDRYSRNIDTVVIKGRDLNFRPGRRNPERSVIEVDLRHYFPRADLYEGIEVNAELRMNQKLKVLNHRDLGRAELISRDSRFVQL